MLGNSCPPVFTEIIGRAIIELERGVKEG